jgi:acyl-CoA synthetase (AMP-forming)/AMP-acid ligase II
MSHADPAVDFSHDLKHWSIYPLLSAWAERSPSAVAIVAPGRAPLTYGRLGLQIADTVATLNAMGLGRNDRVALVLPQGPEMTLAFLAVAAGAACVPLNPAYRANEFDFLLADLHAKAVVMQSGVDSPARAITQARGLPILELSPVYEAEAGSFTLSGERRPPPTQHGFAHPGDVALVLHTSGTTAQPKIVPLTQTNICMSAHNHIRTLALVERDRCLNVMPLFHIHGLISAVLASLVAGASVVCAPGFSTPDFFAWMEEFCPTWYTAAPTIHQAVLAGAAPRREMLQRHPLRFVRSAAAALPPQVMQELEQVFNAPVIESYGMTEAAAQITSNPLPPGQRKPGSVGRPAGPEVAIMDEAGHLLPPGAAGEIVIRGANVIQAYEDNPTANMSAFTEGWFRTGDQGRLDPEGYLFITGRLKELINRGGEKISPREVEEVLIDHPAVAQVVAFAVPHAQLGEEVAAAVVLGEGGAATGWEIRAFAATRLADFKVPSRVLVVDEIPHGPTGKLQRIGLAETLGITASNQRHRELRQTTAEYVAPRTPVERALATIWAEVLGLDQVGIHDNFFELGVTSIRGTMLINKLQEHLKESISTVALFDAPTVAALAAFLTTNYGAAVSRVFGAGMHAGTVPHQGAVVPAQPRRVDVDMIEQMRQLIIPLAPRAQSDEWQLQKNPPAIFVLAPPRSGTTLLRVMLAGHPQLFAPAELQLLGFNTLGERRGALSGRYSLLLEGIIRAVMHIQGCDADCAKRIIAQYEDQGIGTKQVYRVLQDWIAPRTLVDTSLSYALDLETLKRAESNFDEPFYIHLVRHPYAMVRSFERSHMEQVFFMPKHPFSTRELGELVWVVSHQNIIEFLSDIPDNRRYCMRFEDLTLQPQVVMEDMCQSLGLAYHPGLIEPCKDKEKKMTDGICAALVPMGDEKFNQYQSIDPRIAESWKHVMRDSFLGEVAWEWAERLGYERTGHQVDPGGEWRSKSDDSMENLNAGKTRLKRLYQQRQNTLGNGRGRDESRGRV